LCNADEFASNQGQVQCNKCPANTPRSAPRRTFCLFADTPSNVIEIDLESVDLVVSEKNASYVTEFNIRSKNVHDLAVSFYAKEGVRSGELAIYSSDKTGHPSANNHDVKAVGQEPLQMPIHKLETDVYVQRYFTITPRNASQLLVSIETMAVTGSKHVITPDSPSKLEINCAEEFTYILFNVPNVSKGTRVRFASTLDVPVNAKIGIYHNRDRQVEYPNVWSSVDTSVGDKSTILEFEDNGDVPVGVYIKYSEFRYECKGTVSAEVQIK
jgi:hypothetical protein